MRKYELTESEAQLLFELVSSHCQTLKNWMATQVENGDLQKAQSTVKDLRIHQALFAKLNVEAHKFIDGNGK